MLTFYSGSGSPYAWRVQLALEFKGVPYDLKMLSFSAGDTRSPEFLALNPRHQVPVLVDDGFVVYESAAIVEYLEERFPQAPSLFPGDLRQRATIRRLVREVDGHMVAANNKIARQLFSKPDPSTWDLAVIEEGKVDHESNLEIFESYFAGEFLAGPLSAADFTLYPFVATIARFEKRKPDLDLSSVISPRIRKWCQTIEALPYFDKTYPPHWRG